MNLINYVRQPHGTGISLFTLAATTLVATIITSILGLTIITGVLMQIAQPACACAIAVLMYLGMVARRQESAATTSKQS